ncbi:MAG: PaaI family thioesterase [Paracoccaceae bacterium]
MSDIPGLDPRIAATIRDSFARQTMMQSFGATLEALAPGEIRIAAPILPGSLQQHGHAHAALAFAIGDSAAGYAALSLMPEGSEVVTAEIKVNFLAPARGERLLATGRVIRAGRRLSVVTAEVLALQGGRDIPVALLQGTMIPASPG